MRRLPIVALVLLAAAVTLSDGTGTLMFSGVCVPVDKAQSIIATPSGYYFNVHSALNPGGAVRGQLVRQ